MRTLTDKAEKLKFLKNANNFNAIGRYTKEKVRCVVEDENNVFVFCKHCRKYGSRWNSHEGFADCYDIVAPSDTDINAQWQRRIKRAVKCMEQSGLWSDVKEYFQTILDSGITYQEKKRIEELYWEVMSPVHLKEPNYNENVERAFAPFIKYSFMFYRDNSNKLQIKTSYIWERSECKLKSMYFGKYQNSQIKEEFKKAIAEKRDYHRYRIRTNYDVTLEYKAENNMAWYSEEYKDCGNGHYYIALDHSTALFVEDD